MGKILAILHRLGPGLITASLVLGPGSVVSASRAGAQTGYSLVWVLVVAGFLMASYTAMGARLGCALEQTVLGYVARRKGRWLAVLAGLSAFLVTAGFQFGNNLGVAFASHGLTGTPLWLWPPVFTCVSIVFLFGARRLYPWVERVMMALVGVMIVAFVANLFWTKLEMPDLLKGFLPRLPKAGLRIGSALTATTFSAVAAFYQAYLVQAKGWTRKELATAIQDAWIGIAVLCTITAVILFGSAESLYGSGRDFEDAGELAGQLKGLLGPVANLIFCLGLGAASFSSFVVNALVGGHLLADGLGVDSRIDGRLTKLLAAAVMVVGCTAALATFQLRQGTTTSLLVAQASTLVAAPLCAIVLFWLTCSLEPMGELRNRFGSIVLGLAGLVVILGIDLLGLLHLCRILG